MCEVIKRESNVRGTRGWGVGGWWVYRCIVSHQGDTGSCGELPSPPSSWVDELPASVKVTGQRTGFSSVRPQKKMESVQTTGNGGPTLFHVKWLHQKTHSLVTDFATTEWHVNKCGGDFSQCYCSCLREFCRVPHLSCLAKLTRYHESDGDRYRSVISLCSQSFISPVWLKKRGCGLSAAI